MADCRRRPLTPARGASDDGATSKSPLPSWPVREGRERMAISLPDVARFIYAGRFGHVYALLGSRRHVLGFVDCAKQARMYISRDFIKNPPTLFFPSPPPSRCCRRLLDPVVASGNVTTGSRRRSISSRSVFKHPITGV